MSNPLLAVPHQPCMIPLMIDWNAMTLILVIILFLFWNLEMIASLLNLKAFPLQVPEELSQLLDQEKLDRAREYQTANTRLDLLQSVVMLMALLTFWMVGGFEWLDLTIRQMTPRPIVGGLAFVTAIFLGQSLLQLPFSVWHTFGIEERFGFNRSTVSTFLVDRFKGLLLGAVIGLPLLAVVLWIFLTVGHAWLWAWLVFTALQLLLAWLAPSLILPLFNKFTPMEDEQLKADIEKLGKECGFPLAEVSVMDGSKRSTKANAFFTGFGKRKKIALYDTLIEKSSREELLGVLAHEIGHFRRGHIKQRLGAGILQSAVIFYLLGLAIDPRAGFAPLLFEAFGVSQISPHVGLVLFMILLEPVSRLLGIPLNAWSRRHEYEADAYAVEVTGQAQPLMDALRKMTADHLSHPTPSPLRVALDYSHPPLIERLRAMKRIQ